jgi:GDP-L-fucose synthase
MTEVTRDLGLDKILVTGSGGVLGTAVLRSLRRRGIDKVAAPSRTDCDLLDEADVRRTFAEVQPTLVIHLAGWVAGVQGNLSFPADALYANARMNLNVIDAARQAGVTKIVCAGTTAIYSDQVPKPMREDDLWQGVPHGSEASYAHAKRFMLAQLEAYQRQYGVDFAYLICTNLYGPNDRFDEKHGHVVPSLVARFHRVCADKSPAITIWGDGTPTRDFLYSEDAAEGFIAAAEKGSGIYNLATGQNHTIRQLAECLKEVSGFAGEIAWDTSKPLGQIDRSYDVSRLQSLSWKAKTGLAEGLKATFDWYAANQDKIRR